MALDELLVYLCNKEPHKIIIGEKDCNLLLLGDGLQTSAKIKTLLLTAGCEKETNKRMDELRDKYRKDGTFKKLFKIGKEFAEKARIPFVLVGYEKVKNVEKEDAARYVQSTKFCVKEISSPQSDFVELDSDGLAEYLYASMGIHCDDRGTHKAKNKHIADGFHLWSRIRLSSRIVKQDFDAIYVDENKYTLIEVKRSPKISLHAWTPFKADKSNYDILYQMSQMIGASFLTLHHRGELAMTQQKWAVTESQT